MSWIQTDKTQYQEVVNNTGNNINAYSIVYASGYDVTDKIPEISIINSYNRIPLGMVSNSAISNGEINHIIVKGVISHDTSSYTLYDKVYCDDTGQITFSPTPLLIGTVIETSSLGKLYIDVNYIFTSQINNVITKTESGNINNLNIGSFNYILLTQATSLTGITSGFTGRVIAIHNENTDILRLINNSSLSSTSNKLILPEEEIELDPNGIAKFIYDGTYWKLIGGNYNNNINSSIITISKDGTSFDLGTPVYIDINGDIQPAIVNTQSNLPARGLIYRTSSNSTRIILSGKLELTTTQWDLLTGGSGGLETGKVYYTSSSDVGKITTNKPYIGNSVLMALDSTTALVQIGVVASESIPSTFESWLFR